MESSGCVHELFERQAAKTPAAIALVSGAERVTYSELDARADRLAGRLAGSGVRRGDLVGIHAERGSDMVVAALATLKAGAGYVMLDPQFPAERRQGMLRDTGATIVIGEPVACRDYQAVAVSARATDADPGSARPMARGAGQARPQGTACVMFTSGSTGRPKAVAASHQAVTGTLTGQSCLPVGPGAVWLQCAPVSWDVFVLELWGPLLAGGTCVLYPGQRPDPMVMAELVAVSRINTMFLSCSLFNVIVDEYPGVLENVRHLMVGGEAPSAAHLARAMRMFPKLRLLNGYGPVEAMIVVTAESITAEAVAEGLVPIGQPLAGKHTYVLDDQLRPVADGQTGELYAAGAGLAHGYLGRPELTADRFIACPFGRPGDRMYRTGDLVRRHRSGALEFTGRADRQVKIRGFRVEPAEVEAVLAQHPAIMQLAVVVRRDSQGEKELAAYIVPRPGEPSATIAHAVRAYAVTRLPDFMVPSAFVFLSALPLTSTGKLDRAALPPPGDAACLVSPAPPRTQDEDALLQLIADILGVSSAGIDDNFFELGGNSLQAARLVSRIRAVLGVQLSIRSVFEAPTVASLAQVLGDPSARRPAVPAPWRESPGDLPLSYAQRRLWLLDQIGLGTGYTVPIQVRLDGEVSVTALRAALADVVARHETLRTVFTATDGLPVQRVLSPDAVSPQLSVRRAPVAEFGMLLNQAMNQGFDLSSEIPIRGLLLSDEHDGRRHVLLLVVHHIAADGWSLSPLLRDLSQAYEARLGQGAPAWRPLPVQYRDYAIRQREELGDPADPASAQALQLGYWTAALGGVPDSLAPLRTPGGVSGHRSVAVTRQLGPAAHGRLAELVKDQDATLFMVLQAALAAVLHRAGAGDDIAVGTVVAGRTHADLDSLVGFFVNMLILRLDLSGDPTVGGLLARSKETSLAALTHQDVPFDQVVSTINPQRVPGRHPLVDVVLVLQNNLSARLSLPGARTRVSILRPGVARFGILVEAVEEYSPEGAPLGLTLTVEYQEDAFGRPTADWLASCLADTLEAMAERPAAPLTSVTRLLEDPPLTTGTAPSLPMATASGQAPARPEAPREGLEQRLAAIWADVLGTGRVGRHEDFFDLGGNSLRAVRVAARIAVAEGLPARAEQIFATPTVAGLAGSLTRMTADQGPVIPRVPRAPRRVAAHHAASAQSKGQIANGY